MQRRPLSDDLPLAHELYGQAGDVLNRLHGRNLTLRWYAGGGTRARLRGPTRADRDALIQRFQPAADEMCSRWRGIPMSKTLVVHWPERLQRSDPLFEWTALHSGE